MPTPSFPSGFLFDPEGKSALSAESKPHCDVCDAIIEGPPAGRGLLLWTRGDEVRYEEPPLCDKCARAITAAGARELHGEPDDE